MKTYNNFELSKSLLEYLSARKGGIFMRAYYDEHGECPSTELVNEASVLTEEEIERYKGIAYSCYASKLIEKTNFTKPEVNQNTPEQAANEQTIVDTLLGGTKNVTIDEGTVNNVTIPSNITVNPSITAEFEDGAYIKNESTKTFTLVNTSEEPVSVTIETPSTVYTRGEFEDIYFVGKTLGASGGQYANVSGDITIDPSVTEDVAITFVPVGNESGVNYAGEGKVRLNNFGKEATDYNVFAPNGTAELSGKYNTLTAQVGEDTLILRGSFHAKEINMKEGHILYEGVKLEDFVDKALPAGVTAEPRTTAITNSNVNSMTTGNPGRYVLTEDIVKANDIAFGTMASGKYLYDLNGHTFTCGRAGRASLYMANKNVQVTIVGEGKFINNANSYCLWNQVEGAVINIYGGDFEGYTHTVYCKEGEINIYGGSFKLLGVEEAGDEANRYDINGHEKYLINCLDSGYLDGTARINIYGGKYYNFNPAESYGEPNGPVSFVAPGYHVIESVEEGVPVFEVVKN